MDIQIELKNDLTSMEGAIQTQEGIYIPLKEVERMLINRIQQVKNNDLLHSVSQQSELLKVFIEWHNEEFSNYDELPEHIIDMFIKQTFNRG